MKSITLSTLGLLLIITLGSCASSYKNINPENLAYGISAEKDGIRYSYKTNVLQASNNRKYVKKESRSDISVVAVKITNTTDKPVIFNEDFAFTNGLNTYEILSPQEITSKIKQSSASYLLYLLLTPVKLYIGDESGEVSEHSIGYVLGPGIAFGNMIAASSANTNFRTELNQYSLLNKEIMSGETVYGLLGIRNFGYGNLQIRTVE